MTFQRGNRHATKLKGEDVLTIRERYATEQGLTQGALAREFGVSVNTIRSVLNYETWQHTALGPPRETRPPRDAQPTAPPQISDEEAAQAAQRIAARLAQPVKPAGSWYDQPVPYDEPELPPGALRKLEAAMKSVKLPVESQVNNALDQLKGDQHD